MSSLLNKLSESYNILSQLIPYPPPPEIGYVVEKDSLWIQGRLDSLNADIVRLPLDNKYQLTNQTNFLNIVAWDWVDSREWRRNTFDCDKFAVAFKSHVDWYFSLNQVGVVIDYKAGHAYNIVVFPDGKVMLLEPQSDSLFVWAGAHAVLYVLKNSFILI